MNLQERMALVGRIEALEKMGDLAARVEVLEAALRKTNDEIQWVKLRQAKAAKSMAG
ncbi:MAG TPA: hypothetical protein VGH25_07190 [Dongiaceae bacterium]|jgi:hypothetical protein